MSFVFIATIGIALGVIAALRHGRPLDHTISVATYLGIAVPEFFWAIVVIMVFAAWLGWLPASGYEPIASVGFVEWAQHIIAPVMTLVFGHLAHVSRLTRSSMIEVLQSPYVMAARAKGLPERVVVVRHALRNALLPTITVLALDIGRLMGGIVVIETVFAYPGLGRLLVFSIQSRDIPTLQASILVVAAIYALANLGADLLYAWLNPKIRYGRELRLTIDAGPARKPWPLQLKIGLAIVATIVVLGARRALDRAASRGTRSRSAPASGRRMRPTGSAPTTMAAMSEPAADGCALVARDGARRDAGERCDRRAGGIGSRLFPWRRRRDPDADRRRADGNSGDHARAAGARGDAAGIVENGAGGRLRLHPADRPRHPRGDARSRQRGVRAGGAGSRPRAMPTFCSARSCPMPGRR